MVRGIADVHKTFSEAQIFLGVGFDRSIQSQPLIFLLNTQSSQTRSVIFAS